MAAAVSATKCEMGFQKVLENERHVEGKGRQREREADKTVSTSSPLKQWLLWRTFINGVINNCKQAVVPERNVVMETHQRVASQEERINQCGSVYTQCPFTTLQH